MLPSKELRELSKRVDICLSGKISPQGCDIRYRQKYWLLVFSKKGELLSACALSKQLSKHKKAGMSVPAALIATVDEGLAAEHSLEQLEQQYLEQSGSEPAYIALREKVAAMAGVGQMRVAGFLAKTAPETADPGLSQARAILLEANACKNQVISHRAFAALRASIEGFVLEHPTHAACDKLIEPLAKVALKYSFDLSALCESYARRWTSHEPGSKAAKKRLAGLAQQLLGLRDAEIARAEKRLAKMKPKAYDALRLRAQLGRAKSTLTGLDAGRSFGVMKPIHTEWRAAATAKQKAGEQRD